MVLHSSQSWCCDRYLTIKIIYRIPHLSHKQVQVFTICYFIERESICLNQCVIFHPLCVHLTMVILNPICVEKLKRHHIQTSYHCVFIMLSCFTFVSLCIYIHCLYCIMRRLSHSTFLTFLHVCVYSCIIRQYC